MFADFFLLFCIGFLCSFISGLFVGSQSFRRRRKAARKYVFPYFEEHARDYDDYPQSRWDALPDDYNPYDVDDWPKDAPSGDARDVSPAGRPGYSKDYDLLHWQVTPRHGAR